MRTHTCNELHHSNIGETATLIGWVNSNRDHGGVAFIDLRDREGLTQCVFRPEDNAQAAELAKTLRSEDMIQVTGMHPNSFGCIRPGAAYRPQKKVLPQASPDKLGKKPKVRELNLARLPSI